MLKQTKKSKKKKNPLSFIYLKNKKIFLFLFFNAIFRIVWPHRLTKSEWFE